MPIFHRRVRALGLIIAVAVVVAACGTERIAASVNGVDITLDRLLALDESYEAGDSLNSESVRQDLSLLIIEEAIVQAAAEQFGLVLTDEGIFERIVNPPARYASVFSDLVASDAASALERANAVRSLVRDAVVPAVIEAEVGIARFIAENPTATIRVCVEALAFLDPTLAQTAADQLTAGGDFATVAQESAAADPGRVGALTNLGVCPEFAASDLSGGFAELAIQVPLNEWIGPVEIDEGIAVLRVSERLEPPRSGDLSDALMDNLNFANASDVFTPWFNDAVRAAEIEVNPIIGGWSDAGIGIRPPGD